MLEEKLERKLAEEFVEKCEEILEKGEMIYGTIKRSFRREGYSKHIARGITTKSLDYCTNIVESKKGHFSKIEEDKAYLVSTVEICVGTGLAALLYHLESKKEEYEGKEIVYFGVDSLFDHTVPIEGESEEEGRRMDYWIIRGRKEKILDKHKKKEWESVSDKKDHGEKSDIYTGMGSMSGKRDTIAMLHVIKKLSGASKITYIEKFERSIVV